MATAVGIAQSMSNAGISVQKAGFGRNVFEVTVGNTIKFNLYIKVSNRSHGFWGLRKSILINLTNEPNYYYVMFADQSGNIVATLTADDVNDLLVGKTPANDNEYKIHWTDL